MACCLPESQEEKEQRKTNRKIEKQQDGKTNIMPEGNSATAWYREMGKIDLHQADAHNPRGWLFRRGQARIYHTCVSKHIYSDAEHDTSYGYAANPLWEFTQYCNTQFILLCYN